MNCKECSFWAYSAEPINECRRFPPTRNGFVMTRADCSCGEFAKKPDPPAPLPVVKKNKGGKSK